MQDELCMYCKYWKQQHTYKGTGYCTLYEDFTDEDYKCEDWEEENE